MTSPGNPTIPPARVVNFVKGLQGSIYNFADRLAPPFAQVLNHLGGSMKTQIIHAAAKLEVADRLADGPRSAAEIAADAECDEEAVFRLLRAIASLGILKESADRVFELTAAGQTLRKSHPMTVYPLAMLVGEPMWTRPMENIMHSLRTGQCAFEHIYGEGFFDHLCKNEVQQRLFNDWMTTTSNVNCPAVAASYPFSKFQTVVDIGGGHGALLTHVLRRHAGPRGILFDLPSVVDTADEIEKEFPERVQKVGGDFFESVPKGADLYMMQQIIHDWDDEHARKILTSCREAMAPGGRILVVDALIQPGNALDFSKVIDIQMLIVTRGGKERTKKQFASLFRDSGLRLNRVIPTASMFSIVEGCAA